MMSGTDKQAQLDRLIDQAVEEFLLVPDNRLLERVEELTGAKESLATEFDGLMGPILSRYEAQPNQSLRIQSAEALTWTWRQVLPWNQANNFILGRMFFSRPMRSALASLVLIIIGATFSFPLWRTALGPDSNIVEPTQNQTRNVSKDESPQKPVASGTGDSLYIAQVVKSTSFAAAAEALDRINAKHPSLLKDRSLLIHKANSGENPGGYIGGVGGLKSEFDAEELCVKIRASGDPCNVVNVPNQ
jgi:hypothetical protein